MTLCQRAFNQYGLLIQRFQVRILAGMLVLALKTSGFWCFWRCRVLAVYPQLYPLEPSVPRWSSLILASHLHYTYGMRKTADKLRTLNAQMRQALIDVGLAMQGPALRVQEAAAALRGLNIRTDFYFDEPNPNVYQHAPAAARRAGD